MIRRERWLNIWQCEWSMQCSHFPKLRRLLHWTDLTFILRDPVLYFSQCLDAGDKVSLMQPGASHLKKVSVSCPCRFQGYLSNAFNNTTPLMFHWFEAFIMSLPPFYEVRIRLAWRSLGFWLVLASDWAFYLYSHILGSGWEILNQLAFISVLSEPVIIKMNSFSSPWKWLCTAWL